MSSASPSGAGMNTLAAPVARSTSHISLPTTVPASRRPCASTAKPCTPWNDEPGTRISGADQLREIVLLDFVTSAPCVSAGVVGDATPAAGGYASWHDQSAAQPMQKPILRLVFIEVPPSLSAGRLARHARQGRPSLHALPAAI